MPVFVGVIFFVLLYIVIDFSRFLVAKKKEKEEPEALKTDAGGVLFVQGNKTYYCLPNGSRRKIADYAFDLNPGSKDMNMFTGIMNKARSEMQAEASNKRKAAINNIVELAKQ